MSALRIDRFTVEPAKIEELLARRATLIAAVRAAVPGLRQARLARVDDQTWIDMWHWESLAQAQAAVAHAQAGGLPEAGAAFALTGDLISELTEIVDER